MVLYKAASFPPHWQCVLPKPPLHLSLPFSAEETLRGATDHFPLLLNKETNLGNTNGLKSVRLLSRCSNLL